jgi:hypothetical protein
MPLWEWEEIQEVPWQIVSAEPQMLDFGQPPRMSLALTSRFFRISLHRYSADRRRRAGFLYWVKPPGIRELRIFL